MDTLIEPRTAADRINARIRTKLDKWITDVKTTIRTSETIVSKVSPKISNDVSKRYKDVLEVLEDIRRG